MKKLILSIAGKAEDAENVLRVKASVKDFETETNMSVICEDGSFYAFNVKYADEPEKLSIEMKDFLSTTEGRLPSNRADIYFKELGNESPVLVKLMMQTIYQNDRRCIKHIGAQQFGIKFLLRGLYAHNGLLYFHTRMENGTNMPYSVDFITFVRGMGSEHTVFALEQFSLAEDKQLEVTLYERNGGRTLTFYVTAEDLQLAKKIDNLKLKW